MTDVRVGDIIQITDKADPWYPCLLTVTEIKSWGVQAFVAIPNSNDGSEGPGQAFRRLKTGLFEVVGKAVVVPDEHE